MDAPYTEHFLIDIFYQVLIRSYLKNKILAQIVKASRISKLAMPPRHSRIYAIIQHFFQATVYSETIL